MGENVQIGHNAVIMHTDIGDNVIIGHNTTIGCEPFTLTRMRGQDSVGRVKIGNNVEIGSNCAIARGLDSDTVIGDGTKTDNLVHVGHDVKIGRNVLLIANCMIAGRTVIEDGARISPSASIVNAITVGAKSTVGMGAVVLKDVEECSVVVGVPARRIR
jgi:UDP-3-O-[3-hydroxymyristoyl] glucosamine N-acyltransferase